jgi:hypothetical protein
MTDYAVGATIYGKFTTFRPSTGAPFTLAGTPVLSVYKDNSVTQSTAGVTLTANFDSVTGLNHFTIDTSADGTFYSAGSDFSVVVTTGTVDSVSAVGMTVFNFSLAKSSATQRIGAAGAGLTAIGDTRMANLDAAVSSRMATYTQPTGFLAATFPTGTIANTTNITAGTITTATNLTNLPSIPANWLTATGIAADAITAAKVAADVSTEIATGVWAHGTRILTAGTNIVLAKGTGVTGFNDLDAAGVAAATWNAATATYGTAGSYGLLVETNLDAPVTSRMATYTQPTGFLAATFPTGTIANTTNITAGTITTVGTVNALANNSITSSVIATNALSNSAFTTGFYNAINAEVDQALADYDGPTNTELNARTLPSADYATATALAVVDGVADDILVDTGTTIPAQISALSIPTANENADALLDRADAIEAGLTLRGATRLNTAVLAGKVSGGGTGTEVFRNVGDTKDRVTSTVDVDGNRTAVTTDAT